MWSGPVIGAVAFAVAMLTLFSGFGLGTLLMPAFALFFPVPVAVAATAVVHVLNNLFKLGLLRRHVDLRLAMSFGIPAALAAFPGAWLLTWLSGVTPWAIWSLGARRFEVTPVGAVMGVLILGFAALELVPALRTLRAPSGWLWLGGILSGFFGGLSGNQGALRAAFLSPLALAPSTFAATNAVIAVMVDAARLLVYGVAFFGAHAAGVGEAGQWPLVGIATLFAFAGSYLGTRLLPKVTVGFVRVATGMLLLVVGLGLASGLI